MCSPASVGTPGDLDPLLQLIPGMADVERDEFERSDDPRASGLAVLDDISELLGARHDRLRYDRHGVGWWGKLEETLPIPPD